jgi:hypothetical protein
MGMKTKTKTLTRSVERVATAEAAEASILDELVAAGAKRPGPVMGGDPLIGECVDPRHPTLQGRVRVAWKDARGNSEERWLPTLGGVLVRRCDRVLIVQPANFDEPVVAGVLDGFSERPEPEALRGPVLAVERDEALHVTTSDGEALLEIRQGESGPVVKIVKETLELELPGRLRLAADSIELQARRGAVKVSATDDVIVQGEVIKLN